MSVSVLNKLSTHIKKVIKFYLKTYRLTNLFEFGGIKLNDTVEQRAIEIARYIIETECTVRSAAKKFGVSKSTVHKDITTRLKEIDGLLFNEVDKVMQTNKAQRHIRGGEATKRKYSLMRKL